MRVVIGLYVLLAFSLAASQAAGKAEGTGKPGRQPKASAAAAPPKSGVKTPGVQIPAASLKAETELRASPSWLAVADELWIPAPQGSLVRIDSKTNKMGEAVPDTAKLCGGAVAGFGSLWVAACGDGVLLRVDPKTAKLTGKVPTGTGSAEPALAATGDSIWALTDDRTTLSRIDPDLNQVVSELRLPAGCNTLTYGETALWVTCPAQNRVLRINPQTNLVEKSIEVSAQPRALAIGENSVWVLCRKEGKLERIDPKTNKVSKTIDLEVLDSTSGGIAVGQGSVWVTLDGFPLTRIDPASEKVVQQFWGAGGGAIQIGFNSIWLSNLHEGTLWRLDPKRILATLAE